MATKLNVNIRTVLSNCEELVKDEDNFWRLQKFIKAVDIMVAELQALDDDPRNVPRISGYIERLQALKLTTGYTGGTKIQVNAATANEAGEVSLKEMRQIENTKNYNDMRKDLLADGDALRRRRGADEDASGSGSPSGSSNNPATEGDNMNEAVKYYNQKQEKITEHMLSLTRNLKEQTMTANRIIKRDTEMVSKSAGITDRNINSLGKEAEKLEQHSRSAYKCWAWMLFVFVFCTFVAMVFFMKIMKKKKT
ncbi:vesicle transport protein USE1 isoform X2 [Drosophila obscura]|uniref:vesicle transport protein USE1 isoform X2 n=1 Tax=Drosophila obscura TaxID=7282 RepID=UPI001BB0EEE0|nr:vesicle transport protein USE1 isoform X2 [Drosophila obscura]